MKTVVMRREFSFQGVRYPRAFLRWSSAVLLSLSAPSINCSKNRGFRGFHFLRSHTGIASSTAGNSI